MKIFGIIIEANPFHNGHQYFINSVKNKYTPDLLIAITTTSFSMRGDISVIDKFEKTNILLNMGIDLVIELPFFDAIQSADYFATSAINILSHFKITDIAFGCECTDKLLLKKMADTIENVDIDFDNSLSLKKNLSNYLIKQKFSENEISVFNKPNFTLSLQYLIAINKLNVPINYHIIERVGNLYYDQTITSNYPSATALRILLEKNENIDSYIPKNIKCLKNYQQANENLFNIIKKQYLIDTSENELYFASNEGINNYIYKNGNFNNDYNDFLNSLKSKKYTTSRIKRTILHTLLKTNQKMDYSYDYLRLLGANQKGFDYLNTLPKEIKKLVFSNPNEAKKLNNEILSQLELELKATRLYSIITNDYELYFKEFQLPIKKEEI